MATWAKGIDFKNSGNTIRTGGIGVYGTDGTTEKLYIGLGTEPWNNTGLQLTSSAINFKGNKIYHAGDKPTLSELGAAASSHNHTTLSSVTKITGAGASSSWGSIDIGGSKANWAGIHFSDMGYVFLVNNVGYSGVWKNGGSPIFSFNESGALVAGTVGWDKITSKPSTYTPASHTHNYLVTKGTNTISSTANDTTANWGAHGNSIHWYNTAGYLTNQPSQYGYLLNIGSGSEVHQLWMTQSTGNLAHRGGNSSGWNGTWRTILDSSNYTSYAAAASHTHNYAGSSSAGGAANSATILATARTLTIGKTGKTFNGSANVSWSLSEIGAMGTVSANGYYGLALPDGTTSNWIRTTVSGIIPYQSGGASALGTSSWPFNSVYANTVYEGGTALSSKYAAASHSHSYLPLSGGTMTGAISSSLSTATHLAGNQGKAIINSTASGSGYNMLAKMNSTNGAWTMGGWGDSFNLFYTLNTTISAGTNSYTKRLILLNESGNSSFPGTVSASSFSGALSGNASTATTLQTARTINGTSFNGSTNITTANWGTARTLTIGSTGKSVNGSGNVSWSLAEIGAASASHTHSYLPLSGGTLSGQVVSYSNINMYNTAQLRFGVDNGTSIVKSFYMGTDTNGGLDMFTSDGLEMNLSSKGYFTGVYGFYNNLYIETDTSPSLTFIPSTNPSNNTGGRVVFQSADSQNVQLRHEWYDGSLFPFGLVIEKADGNAQNLNAALKVEGAIVCGVNSSAGNYSNAGNADARIIRGNSDSAGSLKIQMGGTSPSFEVVNPAWSTAWFSCGSTGIRAVSYSNFSDESLKTNIKEVSESISDKMDKIKIYNYNYKSDFNNEVSTYSEDSEPLLLEEMPEQRWGVIAQEIEELFPELITESETLVDGENKVVKSVDVYGLTVLTLEFAKELKAEIQSIKEKLGLE